MSVVEFNQPARFVAGTVGEPGSREFYLQVRDARRVEGVAIEKQQVALLAERLDQRMGHPVIGDPHPDGVLLGMGHLAGHLPGRGEDEGVRPRGRALDQSEGRVGDQHVLAGERVEAAVGVINGVEHHHSSV